MNADLTAYIAAGAACLALLAIIAGFVIAFIYDWRREHRRRRIMARRVER